MAIWWFSKMQQSPVSEFLKAGYVKHKCNFVISSARGGTYICPNDLVRKTRGCRHTEESPHHFSTENGSQCKRMTDKLFGNLIGCSVWRVVLLEAWGFCGEGHPEFREQEKGKPMRKMHCDCHILICGIVFWTGSFVVSSKFQLKSQLEIVFVSCTWVLYHLNIFICGLMEIVRRCNKPAHRPVITHNRCLYCSRQFFALIIQKKLFPEYFCLFCLLLLC